MTECREKITVPKDEMRIKDKTFRRFREGTLKPRFELMDIKFIRSDVAKGWFAPYVITGIVYPINPFCGSKGLYKQPKYIFRAVVSDIRNGGYRIDKKKVWQLKENEFIGLDEAEAIAKDFLYRENEKRKGMFERLEAFVEAIRPEYNKEESNVKGAIE